MADDPARPDDETLARLLQRAKTAAADTRHRLDATGTAPRPAGESSYRDLKAMWAALPSTTDRSRLRFTVHIGSLVVTIDSPDALIEQERGRVDVMGTLPDGTRYHDVDKAVTLRCREWTTGPAGA